MRAEDTLIQDPELAAEEAWEVYERASMLTKLGQKLPDAKQLQAAFMSIKNEDEKRKLLERSISEILEHISRLEETEQAWKTLAEHFIGKKF